MSKILFASLAEELSNGTATVSFDVGWDLCNSDSLNGTTVNEEPVISRGFILMTGRPETDAVLFWKLPGTTDWLIESSFFSFNRFYWRNGCLKTGLDPGTAVFARLKNKGKNMKNTRPY